MSNQINLSRAREYFSLGVVRGFDILRSPMGDGWQLILNGKSGSSWTFETARSEPRIFSTIEAAVRAVEEIGGRVVSLAVSG
jgi:hypothetical protein